MYLSNLGLLGKNLRKGEQNPQKLCTAQARQSEIKTQGIVLQDYAGYPGIGREQQTMGHFV